MQADDTDHWTMLVTSADGTTKTFSGDKDIKSLLTGVKEYLEKQKQNG